MQSFESSNCFKITFVIIIISIKRVILPVFLLTIWFSTLYVKRLSWAIFVYKLILMLIQTWFQWSAFLYNLYSNVSVVINIVFIELLIAALSHTSSCMFLQSSSEIIETTATALFPSHKQFKTPFKDQMVRFKIISICIYKSLKT